MELKELRIGNYIRHNVQDDGQSSTGFCEPNEAAITEDDLWHFAGIGLEDAEPIPLTEEWLLKFGFKTIETDLIEFHTFESPIESCFQIQTNWKFNRWSHVWDTSYTDAPIEFVHQLQNLHYCLTGQELEIEK